MTLHTCSVKHSDKHCELVQYLPPVLVHKQPVSNKINIHKVIMEYITMHTFILNCEKQPDQACTAVY
jgi:hypothetical protein